MGFYFSPQGQETDNVKSKEAFLFSLVNPYEVKPVKMPVLESERRFAVACNSSLGPSFGLRPVYSATRCRSDIGDLCIAENANASRSNYSRLGTCYQCPNGKQGDIFLTGTEKFIVADYEVFEFY